MPLFRLSHSDDYSEIGSYKSLSWSSLAAIASSKLIYTFGLAVTFVPMIPGVFGGPSLANISTYFGGLIFLTTAGILTAVTPKIIIFERFSDFKDHGFVQADLVDQFRKYSDQSRYLDEDIQDSTPHCEEFKHAVNQLRTLQSNIDERTFRYVYRAIDKSPETHLLRLALTYLMGISLFLLILSHIVRAWDVATQ